MLGGFLGAGKTTTILRLAQWLQRRGQRPGIITNDQAEGLVDTALMRELNLPAREIVGGCFCCRSQDLVTALEALEQGGKVEGLRVWRRLIPSPRSARQREGELPGNGQPGGLHLRPESRMYSSRSRWGVAPIWWPR